MNERNLATKLLALEQVERWNFQPHLRRQSVAAHSGNVTVITYLLCRVFHISEEEDRALLVTAAFHDFAEAITGDIPFLVKRGITNKDELEEEASEQAARVSDDVRINASVPRVGKMPPLVKLADTLDAWLYAYTELSLGNERFLAIVEELNALVHKYVWICSEHTPVSGSAAFDRLHSLFGYNFLSAPRRELPKGMSHV